MQLHKVQAVARYLGQNLRPSLLRSRRVRHGVVRGGDGPHELLITALQELAFRSRLDIPVLIELIDRPAVLVRRRRTRLVVQIGLPLLQGLTKPELDSLVALAVIRRANGATTFVDLTTREEIEALRETAVLNGARPLAFALIKQSMLGHHHENDRSVDPAGLFLERLDVVAKVGGRLTLRTRLEAISAPVPTSVITARTFLSAAGSKPLAIELLAATTRQALASAQAPATFAADIAPSRSTNGVDPVRSTTVDGNPLHNPPSTTSSTDSSSAATEPALAGVGSP